MFRATTPTHIFILPFDTEQVKEVRVTYANEKKEVILQKTEADCVLDGTDIKVELTQEETLLFEAELRVLIQLRVLTTSGKVMASKIWRKFAHECLDEEVLS